MPADASSRTTFLFGDPPETRRHARCARSDRMTRLGSTVYETSWNILRNHFALHFVYPRNSKIYPATIATGVRSVRRVIYGPLIMIILSQNLHIVAAALTEGAY